MKLLPILLLCATLTSCTNGQYAGPALHFDVGFMGATVGVGIGTPAERPERRVLVSADGKTIKPIIP